MKISDFNNGIDRLLHVMARLRDPDGGCPWDLEQTFRTIAPYTIEEAYEVADAIERDDPGAIREEVGDLLLQVVYYAQMGRERGDFDFDSIADAIAEKMVSRHPHVFGDHTVTTAAEMNQRWETHKEQERSSKAAENQDAPIGTLDGIATNLPAVTRALKLQRRAARVGFDWPSAAPVIDKITEEVEETRRAMADADPEAIRAEIGDLLFAVVNLARKADVDPEQALRTSSRKFESRFRQMEAWLSEANRHPKDASLEELEELWQQAKATGDN